MTIKEAVDLLNALDIELEALKERRGVLDAEIDLKQEEYQRVYTYWVALTSGV